MSWRTWLSYVLASSRAFWRRAEKANGQVFCRMLSRFAGGLDDLAVCGFGGFAIGFVVCRSRRPIGFDVCLRCAARGFNAVVNAQIAKAL